MKRFPPDPSGVTKTRSIIVDAESEGQRLDVFLAGNLSDQSRSRLRQLIDAHDIWVDGRSAKASHKVRAGECISVHLPPPGPAEPAAQDIPLFILYEDDDLVVINKSAGMVVHPAAGNADGTLVNALLHHCDDLSGIGGVLRPGIVHRLDRDTSGVMVVTKNDQAHRLLAGQFLAHSVEKTYLAFLIQRPGARPLAERGMFNTFFGRHPTHRKHFSSRVEQGKRAMTAFRVLERYQARDWLALKVEAKPKTGRTHQIRVHFADAGYPLLGDKTYGGRSARNLPEKLQPGRQALHAFRLSFDHPVTRKLLSFEAPLPADLVNLENALASNSGLLSGPD